MFGFYKTTVGKKIVVASTGVVLFLFVLGHMAGNLKAFMGFNAASGRYKLDEYGEFLRTMGHEVMGNYTALWIVRVVLLLCLLLHLITIVQLQYQKQRARPIGYAKREYDCATYAARSMFLGGLLLLIFIVYHLLHLTTGTLHFRGFEEGAVYSNVVTAFNQPLIVAGYLVAMLILSMHLFHGVWSMFQTLGLDTPQRNKLLRTIAAAASVIIGLGFASVPIAVASGFLNLGQG
ncbi:MAG: succinate dehydrogenase cytochrome b subunit [Oligoflexia bacterium]|nr:succinate dehydrogenase cytochrome b subunit [Oligoflexia bacterium]